MSRKPELIDLTEDESVDKFDEIIEKLDILLARIENILGGGAVQ